MTSVIDCMIPLVVVFERSRVNHSEVSQEVQINYYRTTKLESKLELPLDSIVFLVTVPDFLAGKCFIIKEISICFCTWAQLL